MFTTIGAVLGGPGPQGGRRADRPPVRRGSRLAGSCEGAFWRRTDRTEVRRVLLAARRYELTNRGAGRRNGPLGHVALEVLELLGYLVSYRTGRLEPSLVYLMGKLRRSKDAVVRALAALRTHGFLDWLRRHETVELVEGPGPRVRQVSNAYRLSLPPRAARLLPHVLGQGSASMRLPDDVLHERVERAAWVAEHKAGLPLSELPLLEVEDDSLARVLADLGRAVQERESARRGESQANLSKGGARRS
jgi:hypothetical protein